MDMNLIRTLVAVYQQSSYTKASEILGISQPAVSKSIRRLEDELNTKLFVKQGRGITPTPKAVALIEQLQHGMALIDSALSNKSTHIVTMVEGLSHIVGQMDGVYFQVPSVEQELLFDKLRSQQVDLVIDTVTQQSSAFEFEKIRSEDIYMICRSGHPRIGSESPSLNQFLAEEHITYRATRDGREFLSIFSHDPVCHKRNIVAEASSQAAMLLSIAESDCLGVVFKSFAEKWAPRMGLESYPLPFACEAVPIHMVYHKRSTNSPSHLALRERLRSILAN